jgi:hypothetical protein
MTTSRLSGCGEKVLRDNKQVGNAQAFDIVIQQKEIRIGAPAEALDHRTICTIDHFGAEARLLAFQLIFFPAHGTKEIAHRVIVAVADNLEIPAIRAIYLTGDPVLGQHPGALQPADIRVGASCLELQIHFAGPAPALLRAVTYHHSRSPAIAAQICSARPYAASTASCIVSLIVGCGNTVAISSASVLSSVRAMV